MAGRKLVLDDIADQRAYEREREAFRSHVIALKKRRRVHVGPVITFVFENRDTMRFQIQEMARVEKILTDAAVQHELDTYNALVPEPGQLCATMFLELVDEMAMHEWLPALVGVERTVELRLADGTVVPCVVDEAHEEMLTREDTTAAVHYIRFELTPSEVASFAAGAVSLALTHHRYDEAVALSDEAHAELLGDLRDG